MNLKINNPFKDCEIKFSNTKKGQFEAYASKFNGIDSYRDTVLPGAYLESIEEGKTIPMFINHDSYQIPAGKYSDLKEDESGLLVVGHIDLNHTNGPSLYSALKNETMDALSIGYRIRKGGAYEDEDEGVRYLTNIDLKEISVVNFPADNDARITVVKRDIDIIESLKDAEMLLRDAGYSKSAAVAFVSRVKQLSNQRDAEKGQAENEDTKQLNVTDLLVDRLSRI